MTDFHNKCLLCDSKDFYSLKEYSSAYLVKCKQCNFVFSHRIPSGEELSIHYEKYPRYNISPITIKRYNELLDIFEKFRETNHLLDVGCGEGFFLETAQKRGWKVYGTEYREAAVLVCRNKGIETHHGELIKSNFPNDFFDVITSFEVLEHINNPKIELNKFYQLLRNKGIVYATTPNFHSFSRILLRNKWRVIEYPEHLSYYTPETINYIFKKLLFNKISLVSTGISMAKTNKINEAVLSDHKSNTEVSSTEKIRSEIEKSGVLKIIKKTINSFLTVTGTGDTIKVIYQKH